MNENLRLIPKAAETIFKGGITLLKIISLRGASCFQRDFFASLGGACGFTASEEEGTPVTYSCGYGEIPPEGYMLELKGDCAELRASDYGGLFYGFVTLAQLIHNYGGEVPSVTVRDRPSLNYRGLMLDVARYFFDKEDIFRFADFCALHKLNVIHLHLTDDQGWRMPVKKYPLLTEKGGFRSHTNFGVRPHGGYYTEEDLKEIIAYANARNIEVIPEIDMPGHMQAAIASYPYLGCFGRKLEVATHTGVKHDVLCAGKESTYLFVFDVIDEAAELFGGNTRYIHIGGDEVVTHRWKHCPDCRKRAEKERIGSVENLQSYFISRVADYVESKGFIPVMWNESEVSGRAPRSAVWQYWTDDSGEKEREILMAACASRGVINSSSKHCYMDFPYAYINIEKAYSFVPRPAEVPASKFVGAEMALWTEYVPDFRTACRRLLPRSAALAEVMWNSAEKDFGSFKSRLNYTLGFMRAIGFEGALQKCASPGKTRALFQKLWFERRQLHWQGLTNLYNDIKISLRYGKKL